MNKNYLNREIVISRVKKELIGPGSDIFRCSDMDNFLDEVIEGKPLQRYFSGILFPKQHTTNGADNSQEHEDDENDETPIELSVNENIQDVQGGKQNSYTYKTPTEDNKDTQYSVSTFFPSQYGISFSVSNECAEIKVIISFGNYKKAKIDDITLPYNGDSINLLSDFGLDKYLDFDEEKKILSLSNELSKEAKKVRNGHQYEMAKDHRNSGLYKAITKLFFKDKYKRLDNQLEIIIPINQIKESENKHFKILFSDIEGAKTNTWWKGKIDNKDVLLKDHLWLHLKLYTSKNEKYVLKAIVENTLLFPKKRFSTAKESLNLICLFQTEIKIETPYLIPFNDYKANLYKSYEDKMLDYLYRKKLAYGIGHNTSCLWQYCEDDCQKPTWISSSFLPQYNLKSQSTDIETIDKQTLEIKRFSTFNSSTREIISNLKLLSESYQKWIEEEKNNAENNTLALTNVEKCTKIQNRINRGIELLITNKNAFHAFKLANTAIYLQMFQNDWHFNEKKDGYEAFEQTETAQYSFQDYATANYPVPTKKPSWRPFQLAFILQCLPSFIDNNSEDKELVDLLYFPTGGGKTEAYLALSAFLIFWRRLQYPENYGGVNIIIRYTLRLLSAQQFERATKLILACEFIRQNHRDLGNEKISIGFWVGGSTIPNKIIAAEEELNKTLERLNNNQYSINPFQISNCQWCNTKIIGKIQKNENQKIGHRINRKKDLLSYCLNPHCNYSENNGGLPIVLVDEDIYSNPPTMLFGTGDKFAQLAWKEESTTLFNYKNNRKPELIIQDELHLLNGPLGSLVGLFENVILSLCTVQNQTPKIIASTATVKNVEKQILGLYGRQAQIFPQNATNADDTFFSRTQEDSKRQYIGILPTGKTLTMTSLRLNAAFLFARLEILQRSEDRKDADLFWTILSYFKSLKNIGRFSNKITSELIPEIKQLQVRHLINNHPFNNNYNKLSYRNLELTSRIANERIKKNLDKLSIPFDGNLEKYQAFDLVLATNMISVGLDIERLGLMLVNGMPPNTAEYIQASSRVARKNEGLVFTLFDPNNTRDLSYFEDFVQFHKTFYKQVEPLSITPFAENALDKMFFTLMITHFRHKIGYSSNNMANAIIDKNVKINFTKELKQLFENHSFVGEDDKQTVYQKFDELMESWEHKIQASPENSLFFYGGKDETSSKKNLLIPIQENHSDLDIRVAMQSMRSVEPSVVINLKKY
ncbi:MAG: helicase-related protein [Bacteroidetes bacterium]|nr:helicase-related protein [Bacteroidota bacterium]